MRNWQSNEKTQGRSNRWQFVCYFNDELTVRSLKFTPDDLAAFLTVLQVPAGFIVHDKDTYDAPQFDDDGNKVAETGDAKKLHAHVLLEFDSLKSGDQVRDLLAPIAPFYTGHVEKCIVPSACHRYLCHLDNPEKAQYKPEDVRCLNGFVYEPSVKLSPEARAALIPEIIRFIQENQISSYAHLCKWAAFERPELVPVVLKDYAYGLKCVCESVAKSHALRDSADRETDDSSTLYL